MYIMRYIRQKRDVSRLLRQAGEENERKGGIVRSLSIRRISTDRTENGSRE